MATWGVIGVVIANVAAYIVVDAIDPDKQLARQMATVSRVQNCLLYTSDAADERSSVDLGGRRIIKKKKKQRTTRRRRTYKKETDIGRRIDKSE